MPPKLLLKEKRNTSESTNQGARDQRRVTKTERIGCSIATRRQTGDLRIRRLAPAEAHCSDVSSSILHGDPTLHLPWLPLQKHQVAEQNCREEVAIIEDGLESKVNRLVIPTSQRAEYLRDRHARHLEEKKNLLQGALEIVFWPGIVTSSEMQ